MDNIGTFLDSQPFIAMFLVIGLGYVAGNANPSTGHAIAYPFGVLGPILGFFLFKTLLKPKNEVPAPGHLVVAGARSDEHGIAGLTISEVLPRIPKDVELLTIRSRFTRTAPLM
jgi:putative transport protein